MANAKKCDLCGQFYSESKHVVNCVRLCNSSNTIDRSLPNSENPFDVCPACGAAFVALYHSRKENFQNDSNT